MTVRLGYKASAEQFAPRALVEFAVAAEDHGFDFVATSDHFLPWRPATADGPPRTRRSRSRTAASTS